MKIIIKNIIMPPSSRRCEMPDCKIKIKITDYPCKCEKNFCKTHIFFNIHNCTYEYKKEQQEHLKTLLPKVIGDKITKI